MIKRTTGAGTVEVLSYVCDNCLGKTTPKDAVKTMPGAPIMVYYPYGHLADSVDGPSHFCSDKCVIEFETKMLKKFGNWKSEPELGERVRSSAEWREIQGKKTTSPKARRVPNKKTSTRKKGGAK